MTAIAEAVDSGSLPGRVWMYSNYHCNLACSYCLTESAPGVTRRQLTSERMIDIGRDAADLGSPRSVSPAVSRFSCRTWRTRSLSWGPSCRPSD